MCKTNTSLARVEKYSAVDEALNLIYLYIQEVYSPKEVELICGELKSIARRDDFQCVEVASSKRTYTQYQKRYKRALFVAKDCFGDCWKEKSNICSI